jgi:peroxiredoxin
VVLTVLRGYPGYQCGICTRQVEELRGHAADFAKAGARVVLVYPGPGKELQARAKEFAGAAAWPAPMTLVLDPDYTFTNLYNLRWDAARETAYPSTFVIDDQGVVRFQKVSKTHGGRAKTAEVLKAVRGLDGSGSSGTGGLKPGGYILKPFSADFQRLAGLAGRWKGQKNTPEGGKMDIEVEYRLTSGNSALVERLFKDSPQEMVSVYHDDGDGIMMTHYCGLGNQPRMRAQRFEKDRIVFAFVDASNMASRDEPHMHALTITLSGDDRITHEWAMYEKGEKTHTEAFELTRVK